MKSILFFILLLSGSAQALIIGGVDMTAHDPIQRSTAAMYEPACNGTGGALCTGRAERIPIGAVFRRIEEPTHAFPPGAGNLTRWQFPV